METEENSSNLSTPEPNATTNIGADEIDQETANKLRGDAIGNTMYSEVFVLNTLLQFSDLKWSSEVEDNLCFLWDMTEEKDVCEYLFQASYPTLACSAIQNYNEPRFIEIVVGIFANLLCSKCERKLQGDEIKTIVNLLESNDPYILIQVMRFIHALAFMYEKLEFIGEEHMEKFDFILYNSTNKELLTVTLKCLSSISEGMKIKEEILKGDLLKSVVIAYKVLQSDSESYYEMFASQERHLIIKHLIQIVCNMCTYVDVLNVRRLVEEVKSNMHEFTCQIVNLFNYYKVEDNLLPLNEDFKYYIEAITYIFKILEVGYLSSVAKALYEIFIIIYKKDKDSLDVVIELFCYFISVGNLDNFHKDFADLSSNDIKDMLLHIDKNNSSFDFHYISNLKEILNKL